MDLTTEQTILGFTCAWCVFISACYGSYVACAKNREWYEGFWMGIFLGPFGIIVAACMPTLAPAKNAIEYGTATAKSREDHDDVKMQANPFKMF